MVQIPPEKITEIRERSDIERVVGRTVTLTRKGRRLVGLCPFHREKTPSFGVSPDRQLYHCFGCQAGGDVFDFVMRLEGLEFPEAARLLAREAGVVLPEREENVEEKRQRSLKEQLFALNATVAEFYAIQLGKNIQPLTYLREERHLTDSTIGRFGLGWAPPEWTALTDYLAQKNIDPELGVTSGILGKAQSGRIFDRLRGRVVFPIKLPNGDIAGFGARRADWIEPDGPKYLNSPESPIYDKSSILYGLAEARDTIRRGRQVMIVEGYLDVIALHQAGFDFAVAACGTALTPKHAQLMARLADRVLTLYDGDTAGQEATKKAAILLTSSGLEVRVATLPPSEDPDTFVRGDDGAERMKKLVDEAPAAIDSFVADVRSRFAGGGIAGATQAVEAVKPLILAVSDPLARDVMIAAAAKALALPRDVLARHLSTKGPARFEPERRPAPPRASQSRAKPPPVVEIALLKMMLDSPRDVLAALESKAALRAFSSEAIQAVVDAAYYAVVNNEQIDGPRAIEIVREAENEDVERMVRQALLTMEDRPEPDDLETLVKRLLKANRDAEVARLRREAATTTDFESAAELMRRAQELLARDA